MTFGKLWHCKNPFKGLRNVFLCEGYNEMDRRMTERRLVEELHRLIVFTSEHYDAGFVHMVGGECENIIEEYSVFETLDW